MHQIKNNKYSYNDIVQYYSSRNPYSGYLWGEEK